MDILGERCLACEDCGTNENGTKEKKDCRVNLLELHEMRKDTEECQSFEVKAYKEERVSLVLQGSLFAKFRNV
jgi:hypothetical protein